MDPKFHYRIHKCPSRLYTSLNLSLNLRNILSYYFVEYRVYGVLPPPSVCAHMLYCLGTGAIQHTRNFPGSIILCDNAWTHSLATVNAYMLCVKCLYKRPVINWSSLARPCNSLGTCLPLHLAFNIDRFSCHPSIPPSWRFSRSSLKAKIICSGLLCLMYKQA